MDEEEAGVADEKVLSPTVVKTGSEPPTTDSQNKSSDHVDKDLEK